MAGAEEIRRSLLNSTTSSIAQAIVGPVRVWLTEHPALAWWVGHPLWSLILVVVAIALLVGLFGAVGRLTENIWLTLFQAVFTLVRWVAIASVILLKASLQQVVSRIGQMVRSPGAVTTSAVTLNAVASDATAQTASNQPAPQRAIAPTPQDSKSLQALLTSGNYLSQTRLLALVTRLVLLQQEETALLAEIKQLLTTDLDGD